MLDRNPYDTSIDWLQPQFPVNRQEPIYIRQQRLAQPQTQAMAKKATSTKQARMPKQKAIELVSSLKKGIVVSSVMGFGLIGLLAAGHVIGTTATTVTNSNSSSSTSQSNSSNSNPSNNSSSSTSQSNGGGFFSQGGGFGFGSGSSQSSSSGTSVS